MKRYFLVSLLLIAGLCGTYGQSITPAKAPNRTQRELIKRGYGMFVHFGVNTFSGDEWSDGTVPVDKYNPTQLDCDQWVRVARDAGFRYVLLVTKHHDGFCLWDSQYTDYDVASSPVKTDVVKAVSDACRKYGLQLGLYYSLWDRHEPTYQDKDSKKYVDYMIGQLRELFLNYGPICELWFDGDWDRPVKDWDLPRVYAEVKKMQPACAIGVNHTVVDKEGSRKHILPDSMLVDNKYYLQYFPTDFRLWDPKIAHKSDKKQYLYGGNSYYLPFEHTVCLSENWNWFQKETPKAVRSLDELEELFYWCTSNNNTLIVNIPPDQTGRIRENEANHIIALNKERLHLRQNRPLPVGNAWLTEGGTATASSVYKNNEKLYGASYAIDGGMQTRWAANDVHAELVISFDGVKSFNKVVIFESRDVVKSPNGLKKRVNRIQSYRIDIWRDAQWECVYVSDKPMGSCKVIRFPYVYRADKIRLSVLDASLPPSIDEIYVQKCD